MQSSQWRAPPTNSEETKMNKKDTTNSSTGLDRRSFLVASAGTAAWLAMGGLSEAAQATSPHVLPPLPYAENALEPVITANTISFHYGKHHKTYVDNLNKLITGTEYADLSLWRRLSPVPQDGLKRLQSSTTPRKSGTTRSIGTA